MSGQLAAGVTAPGVAGKLGHLPNKRSEQRRPGLSLLWQHLVRLTGRTFIGLGPSTWLLVDVLLMTVCVFTAYAVFPPYAPLDTPHVALWQASAIFAFAIIISSLVFGLYERETLTGRSCIATRMLLTTTSATVIACAIIYVIMYATVSRRACALMMSVFLVGGTGIRLVALWAINEVHRGLLVVGSKALFDSFRRAQRNGFLQEYRLVGYAATDRPSPGDTDETDYLGCILDQIRHLAKHRVTDLVVGAQAARDPRVMDWMVPCLQSGCRVTNEAIFYEKATGQILVDEITPNWFLFADLKVHCDEHASLKRLTDLMTAGAGLCLFAPLWPIIALAIKLCDGGPVLYSQDRVGQNGRPFKLYKFRTMRPDAEQGKSVWCSPNDPRVTRVGRLLRRARLDELPQLYNVLIGQMSIVGPRPERPDFVEELCQKLPYYAERHLVKPGITGWAQIGFRYGSSVEDAKQKLQFDLYYLKHMSFELDMIILFRTLGTFLRGAC